MYAGTEISHIFLHTAISESVCGDLRFGLISSATARVCILFRRVLECFVESIFNTIAPRV